MSQAYSNNVPPRQQLRGPDTRQMKGGVNNLSARTDVRGSGAKEAEFKYRELLLVSLSFPFGIMLAFGGKPALLVLCFGAIVSYIFDLLGTIEVS
jgi:hypothetical protein